MDIFSTSSIFNNILRQYCLPPRKTHPMPAKIEEQNKKIANTVLVAVHISCTYEIECLQKGLNGGNTCTVFLECTDYINSGI